MYSSLGNPESITNTKVLLFRLTYLLLSMLRMLLKKDYVRDVKWNKVCSKTLTTNGML